MSEKMTKTPTLVERIDDIIKRMDNGDCTWGDVTTFLVDLKTILRSHPLDDDITKAIADVKLIRDKNKYRSNPISLESKPPYSPELGTSPIGYEPSGDQRRGMTGELEDEYEDALVAAEMFDAPIVERVLTALRDEVVRQSERIEELVELRSTVIDIYLDMKCSRQRDFPLKAWRETLDKFGLLENPNDNK